MNNIDVDKKDEITISDIIISINQRFLNIALLGIGIFVIILSLVFTQIVFKVPTKHLYIEIQNNRDKDQKNFDFEYENEDDNFIVNSKNTESKKSFGGFNINVSDYLTIGNLDKALNKLKLTDYNSSELIRHITILPATRGVSELKFYLQENKNSILKDMTVNARQVENISRKLLSEANTRFEIQLDIGRSNVNTADASVILNALISTINIDLNNKFKSSQSALKSYKLLSDKSFIAILDRIEDMKTIVDILQTNFASFAPNINIDEIDSNIYYIENDIRILATEDKYLKDIISIKQFKKKSIYERKINIINNLLNEISEKDIGEQTTESTTNDVVFELGNNQENLFDSGFLETIFAIGRKIDLSDTRLKLIAERKDIEFLKAEIEANFDFYNTTSEGEDNNKINHEKLINNLNQVTLSVNEYINIINDIEQNEEFFSISSPAKIDEGLKTNYTIIQILMLFLLSIILSGSIVFVRTIIHKS